MRKDTDDRRGMQNKRAPRSKPSLGLMTLEPRLMFDGAAAITAAHATLSAATKALIPAVAAPVEVRPADPTHDNGNKEVVFVDSSVSDWQALVAGVEKTNPGVEIELIDGTEGGLAQIATWAETHSGYNAIHILSDGGEATLTLGTDSLTDASLSNATVQAELGEIGTALNAGGELALYASKIGAGSDGQQFISDLAADTGAVVAAADHPMGTSGGWSLDTATSTTTVAPLSIASYLGNLDIGATVTDTAPLPVEAQAADAALDGGKLEVAFVDTSVVGWETLVSGIESSRPGMEIELIDGTQSGLAQMSAWASSHSDYDAIHILSHGSEAELYLGSDAISDATLTTSSAKTELAEIGGALKPGGDLLIYGCDVATGTDGAQFITDLSSDTKAVVAASTDVTGAASQGGNWTLEAQTGVISAIALDLTGYNGLLTNLDTVMANPSLDIDLDRAGDPYLAYDSSTGAYQQAMNATGLPDSNIAVLYAGADSNGLPSVYLEFLNAAGTKIVTYNLSSSLSQMASNNSSLTAMANGDVFIYYSNAAVTNAYFAIYGQSGQVVGQTLIKSGAAIGWAQQMSNGNIAVSSQIGTTEYIDVYSSSGSHVGSEISLSGYQNYATIAANGYGQVFVGLESLSGYTYGAIYSINGSGGLTQSVGPFEIDVTVSDNTAPWVVNLSNGNFAVYYSSSTDAQVKIYSPTGAAVTSAIDLGANYSEEGIAADLTQGQEGFIAYTGDYTSSDATYGNIYVIRFDNNGNLVAGGTESGSALTLSNGGWGDLVLAASNGATWVVDQYNQPVQGYSQGVLMIAFDSSSSNSQLITWELPSYTNSAPSLTTMATNGTYSGSALSLFSGTTISAGPNSSESIESVTMTVSNLHDGANEILNIDGTDVALTNGNTVLTSADAYTVNVGVSGSTATVTVTHARDFTATHAVALVNGIEYKDTASSATSGVRTLELTSIQNNGGTANGGVDTETLAVSVTATVPAPAPAAPGTPVLASASDSGYSSSDDKTNVTLPTFTGTGTTGDRVYLLVDGVSTGVYATVSGGVWSATLTSALTEGAHTITAKQSADGGSTFGTASSGLSVTIDTTAPVIANLNGDSSTFVIGSGTAVLVDAGSNATVTEANMSSGGTMSASITSVAGAYESLGLKNTAGGITTSGTTTVTVSDNGTAIGSYTTGGNGSSGNPLTITLNSGDTVTQVAALIQALTYNDSNASATAQSRSVNVTLTDAAGNTSTTSTATVFDGAKPALATSGTIAVVRTATATALDPSITVSDADSSAVWNTGTLVAQVSGGADSTHDSLTLPSTSSSGIWLNGTALMDGPSTQIGTASAASVSGGTAWTFTFNSNATTASVQAVADAVQFAVSSGGSLSARTIGFTATDGRGIASTTASDTVSVAAQPSISGGTSHSLGDTATLSPLSGVVIADGSSEGVTVTVSFDPAYGDFTGASATGWSGSTVASTRTYTENFASVAAANTALADLVFAPTAHAGDVGTSQNVTFSVAATGDSTHLVASTDSSAIAAVTYGNTTPGLTAGGGTTQFGVGGAAVIIDSGLTVTDPDNGGNGNWNTGTLLVHIQSGGDSANDQLSIASTGNNTGIAVSGSTVNYNGTAIGTIQGGNTGAPGSDLGITFNSAATDSAVQALVDAIKFGGDTASLTARTVNFTLTDGAAASAAVVAETVNVSTGPDVTTIARHNGSSADTNASTLSFDVTFSEAVTGVTTGDFSLTTTGTAVGTVHSVSGSGANWTVTVTGVTGDGTLTLNQSAVGSVIDGSSHALVGTHAGDQSFTIDTTPPDAPVIIGLTAATDTGSSHTDGVTSNTTPTITGTAEANSTISVMVNGVSVGTATTDGSGAWSYSFSSPLAQGSDRVTATATDAFGNVSQAATSTLVVETSAAAPVVTGLTAATDTGLSHSDGVTSVTTPTITGTAGANSTVVISIDGTSVGTVTADANGAWSYAVGTALAQGNHSVTAIATDLAGNTSVASSAYHVVIDTTTPAAPSIAASTVAGTQAVTVSGTAADNAQVVVREGNTVLGTVTANSQGVWSWSGSLSFGTHTLSATATDLAGTTSSPQSVSVSLVAEPPVVTVTTQNNTPTTITPPFVPPPSDTGSAVMQTAVRPDTPTSGSPLAVLSTTLANSPQTATERGLISIGSTPSAFLSNVLSTPAAPGGMQVMVLADAAQTDSSTIVVAKPIGEVETQDGRINFTVPSDAFAVTNANTQVTLSAVQANGQPLPSWLSFDPQTGKFSGSPPSDAKPLQVRVIAHDSDGNDASQVFKLDTSKTPAKQGLREDGHGKLARLGRPGLTAQLTELGREGRLARQSALLEALWPSGKVA